MLHKVSYGQHLGSILSPPARFGCGHARCTRRVLLPGNYPPLAHPPVLHSTPAPRPAAPPAAYSCTIYLPVQLHNLRRLTSQPQKHTSQLLAPQRQAHPPPGHCTLRGDAQEGLQDPCPSLNPEPSSPDTGPLGPTRGRRRPRSPPCRAAPPPWTWITGSRRILSKRNMKSILWSGPNSKPQNPGTGTLGFGRGRRSPAPP